MNRRKLFHQSEDYNQFSSLMRQYRDDYQIAIYHYCLMTNHVHLLLKSETLENLAGFSHFVQRRYAYYICAKYQWNGSVFRQGYRSFPIDRDEYLLECGRYIERNPIAAGMVSKPEDYGYSSYRFYASGYPDPLLTSSPAFEGLAATMEQRRVLYVAHVNAIRVQEEMFAKGLLPALEKV